MDAKQNVTKVNHVLLGEAFPLGATPYDDGCNFAVYAPDAKAVALCLFHNDTEEPIEEILLPEKSGDIWHGFFPNVKAGHLYGYRVERGEGQLHGVPTDKLLIDPYAKKLSRPIHWDARQYKFDSQFMVPKCVVVADADYPESVIRKIGRASCRERV